MNTAALQADLGKEEAAATAHLVVPFDSREKSHGGAAGDPAVARERRGRGVRWQFYTEVLQVSRNYNPVLGRGVNVKFPRQFSCAL